MGLVCVSLLDVGGEASHGGGGVQRSDGGDSGEFSICGGDGDGGDNTLLSIVPLLSLH